MRYPAFLVASTALAFFSVLCPATSLAADPIDEAQEDVLAGHSFHGEAFNEGPRQAAYLMPGLGNVVFPVTTESELAQRFISQGVAQLHGFWYYEAERSFRQAAVLDPDCAMCYWGMAMANVENRKRARDFIAQAVTRKENASKREQLYIDAYEKFCRDEDEKGKKIEKKDRAQTYTKDLEDIVVGYPDDVDARAFLALQLWHNDRAGLPIVSHVAIDSVLEDVFDANPMHPAHHYRIHLWDRPKPERALASAALCGQSLPGIAHMWHMPGHIYSKLHRYQDAVWQQEASARVDHAHMMRDRVLPDQIHNFAHNNEWLIRNLLKVGRVNDAISLAKNMLELPRHPKYNTLTKGSSKYGRERLLLTLSTYRLWPELIELSQTMYLEPTDDAKLQAERTRYLGVAFALSQQPEEASEARATLEAERTQTLATIDKLKAEAEQDKAPIAAEQGEEDAVDAGVDPSGSQEAEDEEAEDESADAEEADAEGAPSKADIQKLEANRKRRAKERDEELKKLQETLKRLEKAIAAVDSAIAAASEDWKTALDLWKKSDMSDDLLKAEWLASSGQVKEGLELVAKEIKDQPGEVLPQAVMTWLVYLHQGSDACRADFELTRSLACTADIDTPLLARLLPIAADLGADEHWATEYVPAEDSGVRPSFDSLGPFRWHPYLAPDFLVKNTEDQEVRLKNISGKPTLVIFYLGFGCLHCVEQLHEFSPRAEQFRESGIDLIGISSEDLTSLNKALGNYGMPLDIPLHADPELSAFKAYRCFDDFEQQPLHGTFLLDPDGRVLWQDISYEPFMDVDFALSESHRLLKLAGFGSKLQEPRPQKLISVEN